MGTQGVTYGHDIVQSWGRKREYVTQKKNEPKDSSMKKKKRFVSPAVGRFAVAAEGLVLMTSRDKYDGSVDGASGPGNGGDSDLKDKEIDAKPNSPWPNGGSPWGD